MLRQARTTVLICIATLASAGCATPPPVTSCLAAADAIEAQARRYEDASTPQNARALTALVAARCAASDQPVAERTVRILRDLVDDASNFPAVVTGATILGSLGPRARAAAPTLVAAIKRYEVFLEDDGFFAGVDLNAALRPALAKVTGEAVTEPFEYTDEMRALAPEQAAPENAIRMPERLR